MALEGMRFTDYYSASPVCSPSRASLLTGKYPTRAGVTRVLLPHDKNGLLPSELTISRMLKDRGYETMCVGKWHLGAQPENLPAAHGFDHFYGLPYSNDMLPLPIMRDSQPVEEVKDQSSLTIRYTEQAVNFIASAKDRPFFLYLSHSMPHIPLSCSSRFRNKSGRGQYGDAVMEMDWSIGQVLAAVRDNGIDENTIVFFTSDNGPWYQGSAGRLRGRKGSTYDGGVREPFIARMPGTIPAGSTCFGLTSAMDLLPTLARLCGATVTAKVDGVDIWPMLSGQVPYVDRDVLLFYDDIHVQCARWGPWKVHFSRYNTFAWTPDPPGGRLNLPLRRPELYDVSSDLAESCDMASERPEVVAFIRERVESQLLGQPDIVRAAWRDTLARRVWDTPAGALPVPENS
jgi:arylsulfatase